MNRLALILAVATVSCSVATPRWRPPEPTVAEVSYTGRKLCSLPAIVAVPKGTPAWQEEVLWAGFEYWNHELGTEVFQRAGVLTSALYTPSYDRGPVPVIIAEYVEPGRFDKALAQPWSQADGFFRTALTGECVDIGWVAVVGTYADRPVWTESIVRHEAGHALGLGHSASGLMAWSAYRADMGDLEDREPTGFVSDGVDARWAIHARDVEIDAVKALYGIGGSK
jgi:hypothetical protein